jgi:hypothetical protein
MLNHGFGWIFVRTVSNGSDSYKKVTCMVVSFGTSIVSYRFINFIKAIFD